MSNKNSSWYLYIIETQKGKLYTGITTDVERRYQQHATGKGARFFRTDAPAKLRFQEAYSDRSAASKAEYATKQLTRGEKDRLIRSIRNQLAKAVEFT